jgi:hypothetical protein
MSKVNSAVITIMTVLALFFSALRYRYSLVSIGFGATSTRHPIAYKIDHWTGKTWMIRGLDAYQVKDSPLPAPVDGEKEW